MAEPPALPAEIPIPESVDFVWEMGLRKIGDQIEMFDALDSKTGVIVVLSWFLSLNFSDS
jgi:hypothetical protein